jgi:S-formylglutathione hydrolase FrmB
MHLSRVNRFCAVILTTTFVGAASAGETAREREIFPGVWDFEFESRVLRAPRKYSIVIPAAIARREGEWPVLFLLHGRGRTHRSLVDIESLRAEFLRAEFCTVFPQGDDGWYIDSPIEPASTYEAYLKEVFAEAGRRHPLSKLASKRAICGWSMGGYGAVRFAVRHPEEFSVVVSIIGLLDFPRRADLPEGQNYTVPVARFGDDPSQWQAFNPLHEADALRDHAVLIITAANAFDRTMNEHFHARLRERKVEHEYLVLPGAHTFQVVHAAMPRVVEFVGRSLARSTSVPSR